MKFNNYFFFNKIFFIIIHKTAFGFAVEKEFDSIVELFLANDRVDINIPIILKSEYLITF